MFKKAKTFAPVFGPRAQRIIVILLGLLLLSYCGWEFRRFGADPMKWDLLAITGLGVFIIALILVRQMPGKMERTLDRLFARGVLETTEEKLNDFKRLLQVRSEIWSRRVGIVVALAILVAFVIVFWGNFTTVKVLVTVGEVIGAYIAGTFLGHMVCYGQLLKLLKQASIRVNVIPGQLDGAAGLKLVGDFYFFQAMVVALPALFLGAWWYLIPVFERYESWRDPYLGLLMLVIAIEVLAFLVPLWSFHRHMQKEKALFTAKADRLCPKIGEIKSQLMGCTPSEGDAPVRDQLNDMVAFCEAAQKMPTWPVDVKVRRRFGFGNLVLMTPFIGSFLEQSEAGKWIMKIIGG